MSLNAPEFSRPQDLRGLLAAPVKLIATPEECAALSKRFGLVAVHSLEATLTLGAEGQDVSAKGPMRAEITQSCAVSGEDVPVSISEEITIRFTPAAALEASEENEEIELSSEDLDVIGYSGTSFDLGEAVAESLALAIDPFIEGPNADAVRREKGLIEEGENDGPLADALRGLQGG